MAGELVVTQDQAQLRDVVMGPQTAYCWADEIPNWFGFDSMRTHDVARSSTHGTRGGRDLLPTKTITGQVLTQALSRAALLDQVDAFMAGWAPSDDDLPLVAYFLSEKRRRYGRPRRAVPGSRLMTRFSGVSRFASLITFQFDALDPFAYADAAKTASTTPLAPGAGFTLPVTLPLVIPAGTSTGTFVAQNDGTVAAPWTGRLDGPLTNPRILDLESGRSLQFTANGGLNIAAGDFVDLDSLSRSVLYNGTGDRRLTLLLSQGWFQLSPGLNTIQLLADAGAGTFTMTWRDAYL